ncbi:hypothetical protein L484_022618 [Morus notabilis]|uniref:NAC domain-containing protein n=1 Tax=Morus notabilis TaxID=981085 RepID=W9RIY8_9ROSA|nr:hypothetical protein L484_022618 [Morus notabilis]
MTAWLMYEYTTLSGSRKMDEFVLCKIYNKNNEQKHKLNAQREKPQKSMEPQAHQVAEHAGINYTEEPNAEAKIKSNERKVDFRTYFNILGIICHLKFKLGDFCGVGKIRDKATTFMKTPNANSAI